ncbi:MAG: tripartite tricarboxylate transporter substrate binding protein [Betaproteobacteria bacterium]|jgi:tripartite-type tricarboxylate transporter receptor subunit TctC|nr:tripartite tricarboxylate transporter substrate binding protein [Betaproteobacteria bacterium]
MAAGSRVTRSTNASVARRPPPRRRRSALAGAGLAAALFVCATAAHAQAAAESRYPDRPIRLVVPFPPGGINDLVARIIGQSLSEQMKQSVVIDNRAGAGGTLGLGIAARANPDGYTLAFGATSTVAVSPALYRNLPYDPVKAFAPIAPLAEVPSVALVTPSLPANSMKELVALARSKPGSLNYASAGAGTSQHMGTELLKTMARIDMVHVPYKGGAAAIADLIGGQVQLLIEPLPTAMPHIKSGKVRALAVTSASRLPILPELPTVAEAASLAGYELMIWFGLLAPADTPRPVVQHLNREVLKAIGSPEVRERFAQQGATASAARTPEQFGAFIRKEIARWAEVARISGAKVD